MPAWLGSILNDTEPKVYFRQHKQCRVLHYCHAYRSELTGIEHKPKVALGGPGYMNIQ